jgi:hypothetical protein
MKDRQDLLITVLFQLYFSSIESIEAIFDLVFIFVQSETWQNQPSVLFIKNAL